MRFGMRQQTMRSTAALAALSIQAGERRARAREFVLAPYPVDPLRRTYNEVRYKMLSYTKPEEARQLLARAQEDVDPRWRNYTSMAERWPAASRRGQGEPGSHVEARGESR